MVCPVSVLGNWQRELARFAPGLRVLVHHGAGPRPGRAWPRGVPSADVVLTTYSLVHRDIDVLAGITWGRLVLDEAQQVKNPGTAQSRAVRRLTAARRVALTGTPVENRLSELWSIMDVLTPGLLGPIREFRERFAVPIERDGDEAATRRLQRITGPFVLRRLKSDPAIAPDLPEKVERTDRCLLTREQATLYQAVVDDLLAAARGEGGHRPARRGAGGADQAQAGVQPSRRCCSATAPRCRAGRAS